MAQIRFQPRKKGLLLIGVLLSILLLGLIIFFSPNSPVLIGIFFILLFFSLFYLLCFALNNTKLSLLISVGLIIILLLRFFHLRHWLYPLLTIAIVVSILITQSNKN